MTSSPNKRLIPLIFRLRNTEAALQQELHNVASSAVTIKDLRNTIESLREELHKHGIRQPLDFRLKQLGLSSGSDDHLASSGSTAPTNRYGCSDADA
ncbi:hypothetical protein AAVH_24894 [Aphelenchoides avenae]|nr:hypothetical protein AAVH_24894 [Aphelenchus avenae]